MPKDESIPDTGFHRIYVPQNNYQISIDKLIETQRGLEKIRSLEQLKDDVKNMIAINNPEMTQVGVVTEPLLKPATYKDQ